MWIFRGSANCKSFWPLLIQWWCSNTLLGFSAVDQYVKDLQSDSKCNVCSNLRSILKLQMSTKMCVTDLSGHNMMPCDLLTDDNYSFLPCYTCMTVAYFFCNRSIIKQESRRKNSYLIPQSSLSVTNQIIIFRIRS